MCLYHRKNHGCGQKRPGGTSSAKFSVGTTAKCCKHKRCAERVRSRTDNKDGSPRKEIRNLNFSPSTKKTTEYPFELFLQLIKLFLTFVLFSKTRVRMQFCAKNAGYSTGGGGYLQCFEERRSQMIFYKWYTDNHLITTLYFVGLITFRPLNK